jgi:hypothetical protein
MASQATVAPTVPELHPDDISNLPGLSAVPKGVSLANVPDFEKPYTGNTTVQYETPQDSTTIAHATDNHYWNMSEGYVPATKRTVNVNMPTDFDQGALNHEVFHEVQFANNLRNNQRFDETEQNDSNKKYNEHPLSTGYVNSWSDYDYGGLEGLENLQKKGKSLAYLNREQQAQVLRDYTDKMEELRKPNIISGYKPALNQQMQKSIDDQRTAEYDRYQKAYAPFIHQMAEMASSHTDSIDTNPAPPGPPPAKLTGALKPLPEIGGKTVELHSEDISNPPTQRGTRKK